jgi:hypothetical protein
MAATEPLHHRKPDLRWDALTPTIITTTLATAVVILRLVVRCKFVKAVGFDDFVIMVSLVSSFVRCCGRYKLCMHLPRLIVSTPLCLTKLVLQSKSCRTHHLSSFLRLLQD